ncbi:daunorubicin resistance protein DrrA family ABC transporter ATP-binding protein [Streptomyces cinereoruber]|uniref:ATP-binding cassette domain-containing protein n=1 Tax=Streptomyces cinereoruber TaxID=67260 RepID=A0AAV4KEN2_9ACTN|nr:ATP-binding cassette domain-containing protein [Streptomyces cinereoruber]MBB4156692.1 ABC-2 type transport system ATP-binding protein [Streptomyces cinereoruber]MBY8815476.1 ATP-binding cassette domain-containing protein [Streptomyces cinereoruber]NIH60210.1 ABC-2 type transport system ATP-binding protein [Streptomyces cinereoruber]QEV33981.1 ATP-binding cassette domain-containing protein [Streptomyces cinereoruber]GGR10742.1 daunorubicin resistance protein DrrA family ABC transporter ATP-
MSPAVEATALSKSHGSVRVLDSLDLRVVEGTVFALLGPNGAGKTTTVRILATLTRPDAGHARVAGHDIVTERSRVRRAISLTGQYAAVDETQTGAENLRTAARLSGLSRRAAARRAAELLERFRLTEAGDRLVRTYSGGMRRRLDLAAGLVRDPGTTRVMFLDEPTTGLDPRSRQELWDAVRELSAAGTTVFLTTQYLEEADRLADDITVLGAGRTLATGTPAALKSRYADHRLDLVARDREAYLRLTSAASPVTARSVTTTPVTTAPATTTPVTTSPDALSLGVPTDGSAAHVRALLDALDPERRDIARFTLHTATLDDVFLALTDTTALAVNDKEPSRA